MASALTPVLRASAGAVCARPSVAVKATAPRPARRLRFIEVTPWATPRALTMASVRGSEPQRPRQPLRIAADAAITRAAGGRARKSRARKPRRGQMGFEQYHEPPEELSHKTRTFARMIASLIEEAEAIGWYEQRISLEKDKEARAIMRNAQHEEFKHFGMDLEFLLRRTPQWRETLKGILFKPGDIIEHADEAEEASED